MQKIMCLCRERGERGVRVRERKEHARCLKFYLNCTISNIFNTLCQDHLLTEIKVNYISVIITNQNNTAYCPTYQVKQYTSALKVKSTSDGPGTLSFHGIL
jgi:uncharacterized protein YydD (DUF2326 family)